MDKLLVFKSFYTQDEAFHYYFSQKKGLMPVYFSKHPLKIFGSVETKAVTA